MLYEVITQRVAGVELAQDDATERDNVAMSYSGSGGEAHAGADVVLLSNDDVPIHHREAVRPELAAVAGDPAIVADLDAAVDVEEVRVEYQRAVAEFEDRCVIARGELVVDDVPGAEELVDVITSYSIHYTKLYEIRCHGALPRTPSG